MDTPNVTAIIGCGGSGKTYYTQYLVSQVYSVKAENTIIIHNTPYEYTNYNIRFPDLSLKTLEEIEKIAKDSKEELWVIIDAHMDGRRYNLIKDKFIEVLLSSKYNINVVFIGVSYIMVPQEIRALATLWAVTSRPHHTFIISKHLRDKDFITEVQTLSNEIRNKYPTNLVMIIDLKNNLAMLDKATEIIDTITTKACKA